ncbi:MAG: hypothetical protein ACJAR0_004263 [Candidatus Azotimanducaceae bacterium]|jgi:hypothetical protein
MMREHRHPSKPSIASLLATPDGVSSSLILCLLGFVTPFRFAHSVPSRVAATANAIVKGWEAAQTALASPLGPPA